MYQQNNQPPQYQYQGYNQNFPNQGYGQMGPSFTGYGYQQGYSGYQQGYQMNMSYNPNQYQNNYQPQNNTNKPQEKIKLNYGSFKPKEEVRFISNL